MEALMDSLVSYFISVLSYKGYDSHLLILITPTLLCLVQVPFICGSGSPFYTDTTLDSK